MQPERHKRAAETGHKGARPRKKHLPKGDAEQRKAILRQSRNMTSVAIASNIKVCAVKNAENLSKPHEKRMKTH